MSAADESPASVEPVDSAAVGSAVDSVAVSDAPVGGCLPGSKCSEQMRKRCTSVAGWNRSSRIFEVSPHYGHIEVYEDCEE